MNALGSITTLVAFAASAGLVMTGLLDRRRAKESPGIRAEAISTEPSDPPFNRNCCA
jgi:hypothetical protein